MRQHVAPILVDGNGNEQLVQLTLGSSDGQISESELQAILHSNPNCLPINEIDSLFADAVPLCREMRTTAGYVDNVLMTPTGMPVLVECKLWRNPQARREVVGQIIDYAKDLVRWTASDFQREVAAIVEREGNPIIALLREAGHQIDEAAFNDSLTANLRRGRFLLLIVGDGVREDVESIAEYLQGHTGLHFSLGIVEIPIFELGDGRRLFVPRVLAKTELIRREVVAVPDGMEIHGTEDEVEYQSDEDDPLSRISFWKELHSVIRFDDPDQPLPKPGRSGWVTTTFPVRGGVLWLTIYRMEKDWEVGVYLSYNRDSVGAQIVELLLQDWAEISLELGSGVQLQENRDGRMLITATHRTRPWTIPEERKAAIDWLARRSNEFVNVLRPRIKKIAAENNWIS